MGLVGRGAGQAERESGQSTLAQCWGHTRSPPSHLAAERRSQAEVVPAWLRPASPSGPTATRNYQPRQEDPDRRAPAPRGYPAHGTQVGSLLALWSRSRGGPAAALVRKGIIIHEEDVLARPLPQGLPAPGRPRPALALRRQRRGASATRPIHMTLDCEWSPTLCHAHSHTHMAAHIRHHKPWPTP